MRYLSWAVFLVARLAAVLATGMLAWSWLA